jgi:RNA polymerase sigma-70 factor (ECF subfamily)
VSSIPDERLALIFTCCHPALAVESQVALTLRLLGGLATTEIAAAFLTAVPTRPSGSSGRRGRSARPASRFASRRTMGFPSGSPPCSPPST